MIYKTIGLSLFLILVLTQYPVSSVAQSANQRNTAKKEISLPANTPINLIILEGVSSQRNREGDEILFALAEDVVINDRIYLVKRTPVIGRVTHIKSAKAWGKSGNFDIEITELPSLYSTPIKLTGKMTNGTSGGAVQGMLAGGSIKGKKAQIDPGQTVIVHSSENANIRNIPVNEMRRIVDDWYKDKITSNFLNYSWDSKRTISQTMSAMGYSVNKSKIIITPLENYYYRIDVPLDSKLTASFKFQPFEEGYTGKYRRVEEMNASAKRILEEVK